MKSDDKPTVWVLYECTNGARWSTAHEWTRDKETGVCNFSGCNAPAHDYRTVKATEDRDTAAEWFHRPEAR